VKLLLTSAGLTNQAIRDALTALIGKPAEESAIAVIITASMIVSSDKTYLIKALDRIKDQGFSMIDILDIAGLAPEIWRKRLKAVDAIFVAGGNPYHLLDVFQHSGLAKSCQIFSRRAYTSATVPAARLLDLRWHFALQSATRRMG
jgi:dipeptidase E